jgi:ribose transport system ATP-binding protein
MILHEPTQGVDVGARQEIYQRLLVTRAQRCTICVSNDHDELAALCDRVLVFHRGAIVATLTGSEVEKSRISEACMRGRIDVQIDRNGKGR